MTTIKRVALLLFAGLFGFATLQTATAQTFEKTNASHEVNIEVKEIRKIYIRSNVGPVTVEQLTDPSTVNGEDLDFPGKSNPSQTSNFEIRINYTEDHQVDAEVTNPDDGQIGELGLQVSLTGMDDDEGIDGYQTLLRPANTGGSDPGAQTVADGISQTITDGTLTYRAVATPEFDPGSNPNVKVQYTLTSE
jgi:hypothetical protein